MREVIARDELAVGGPLLLELCERAGIHHRAAGFELMDMNVDHLRGLPDERPLTGWINRGERASGLGTRDVICPSLSGHPGRKVLPAKGGCPDSAVRAATSVRFFRDGLTVSAALSIRGCRIGDRIRQRFGETAVAPVVHMQAIRRERYLERDAVD